MRVVFPLTSVFPSSLKKSSPTFLATPLGRPHPSQRNIQQILADENRSPRRITTRQSSHTANAVESDEPMEERDESLPAPQRQSQQQEYMQEQYENPVAVMVDIAKGIYNGQQEILRALREGRGQATNNGVGQSHASHRPTPPEENVQPTGQPNEMPRERVPQSEEQAQGYATLSDLTAMLERERMRTQRGSLQFVRDPHYPKHIMCRFGLLRVSYLSSI